MDTENSRTSDRCPICLRWIQFCPFVIEKYSDLDFKIEDPEVRCLDVCDRFSKEQISGGDCPYTKYSRGPTRREPRGMHQFADNLHYHYQCVLENLTGEERKIVIDSNDTIALKTHFPYYQGLENLNS